MNFKKSSRILAIALAVVMILPLISVMAFAEGETEETSNVLFSADFENYELTAALDAADDTFFAGINGAALSYKETGLPADVPTKTSGNKIVLDPLAADAATASKVWEQDILNNNNNNNIRLKVPSVSHETVPALAFSFKVYIPEDAKGTVQWQWGTTNPSNVWFALFNIDFSVEGQAGVLKPTGELTNEGNKTSKNVTRGVWNVVTYALDLKTGEFTLYVNGNEACVGKLAATDIVFTADKLHFGKVLNGGADYSQKNKGKIYFDDIAITAGEYTGEVLWSTDYSAYEVGAGVTQDNTNFALNPNDGKDPAQHKIVADPVVDGGKVLAVNNYGGVNKVNAADNNYDNNKAKYAVPAISYETTQAVTFSFDVYIPKDAKGRIHWQWGGTGTDASGAVVTTNKNWNDFIYLYYDETTEFAELAAVGKQNIDDQDASVCTKVPKGEWVTIAWSVDLVNGETNLTMNGKQAWRGYFTVNGVQVSKINLEANALIYAKILKQVGGLDGTNTGFTLFKNEKVVVGKQIRKEIEVKFPEGTMYIQDFQSFKADADLSKAGDSGFISDSKVTEAHKAVADPKNAENIVWYRPLDDKNGANDDPWAKLANERAAFAENAVVELYTDYYLPADATGYFQVQLYGSASGTNNYFHLWDINVTDAKLVQHYDGTANFTAINEAEGAFDLPRDTWFTIRTIIDLVSGKFDIFVDGKWVASCHIRGGDKNIIIAKNNLDVSCLRCSQGAASSYTGNPTYVQSGYVLIDNIELKKFGGSIVKVNASGLGDGDLGTKVNGELLASGVHVFDTVVTPEAVKFDKTPYANLFKSTVGEFRLVADGDEGIRFVSEIDATLLAALLADTNTSDALVKKGTIILPKDYLAVEEGAAAIEVTFEGLAAANVDYLDVTYDDLTAEYDVNKIAGSIINVKNTNYNREFVAVPYVQVTLPHGNTLTIYGAQSEGVTIAKLAADALADTAATFNGAEKALLGEYAAKLKAE